MKALSVGAFLVATALLSVHSFGQRPAQGGAGGGYAGAGVDKATYAKLTKAQQVADAAFKKSPKNPAAKRAFIDANNRHGLAAMRTEVLDRKVKYRIALTDFRKVLRVDPKNAVAKDNSELIISIYKSLNRPVPG